MDYATLTKLAGEAQPLAVLLDPFLSSWNAPGEMTERITAYARTTGQPAPSSDGAFVRTCLESLAMAYREVLESVATLTGEKIQTLHILGGGGQNRLLNQGGRRSGGSHRHRQPAGAGGRTRPCPRIGRNSGHRP
ncbi:MAG: hypothetical protein EBZ07_05400 [Verrucomicrobia bacterium]|nr:hypothetical protein [Verrucomicrobiota bacterium]